SLPLESASSRPSLALKSDPEPIEQAATATAGAEPIAETPSIVLLNPGTADPGRNASAPLPAIQHGPTVSKPARATREAEVLDKASRTQAARQRSRDSNGPLDQSAGSGSEPDY